MYNPFIETLVETLSEGGVATLRFEFRDAADFEERLIDTRAAVAHLRSAMPPKTAMFVTGWSYGADMALVAAARDPEIRGAVGVSTPLSYFNFAEERPKLSGRPVLLVVPENDPYSPPGPSRDRMPEAAIEVLEGANHVLSGMDEFAADLVLKFIRENA